MSGDHAYTDENAASGCPLLLKSWPKRRFDVGDVIVLARGPNTDQTKYRVSAAPSWPIV